MTDALAGVRAEIAEIEARRDRIHDSEPVSPESRQHAQVTLDVLDRHLVRLRVLEEELSP